MIKIAFFDVDGTLIGFNNQGMPSSARQAIEALRQKGIIVCISSGRHLLDVQVLDLPAFDAYITTNGACCIVDDKVIHKRCIPEEDIERLILYLQGDNRFPCVIETADNAYLNFSNHWVEQLHSELHIRKSIICDFDQWATMARTGVEQMLCFFGEESDEKILRDVLPGSAIKRWCPYFTDVIEKDCDKSHGIDILLNHFNLSTDKAIAFGDGGNDITMLQHVGLGIAMGNAAETVKAVADYTTDTVENDGILKALQHFNII